MPNRQGINQGAAYGPPLGNNAGLNDQILLEVVNGSGGALQQGDVVVWLVTATGLPTAPADGGRQVTTTTSAASVRVCGVVSDGSAATNTYTIASGGTGTICVSGVARVNIGSNTVAADSILQTFTTAKQAQSGLATQLADLLGVALEAQTAKDANNTIRAAIKIA